MTYFRSLAFCAVVALLSTSALAAQKDSNSNKADKITLVSVVGSPDPFSPSVHSAYSITSQFEVYPIKGGVGNTNNGKEYVLSVQILILDSSGALIRTLTKDVIVDFPDGINASEAVTVNCVIDWDGKDEDGAIADGSFAINLGGTYSRNDNNGNSELSIGASGVLSSNVLLDNTPPSISVVSPQDGALLNNPTPVISANLSDLGSGLDLSSVKMTVDGDVVAAQFNETTGELEYTPPTALPEKMITINVAATDNAGNLTEISWQFLEDRTPPEASGVIPAADSWHNDATLGIYLTLADSLSGVDASTIDLKVLGQSVAASFNPITHQLSYIPTLNLPEGVIPVSLSVSDNVGNNLELNWQFSLDITLPAIEQIAPSATTMDTTPNISFQISDALSGIIYAQLKVNGVAVNATYDAQSNTLSYTPINALPFGNHTLEVQATDLAGNTQTFTSSFTIFLPTFITAGIGGMVDTPQTAINILNDYFNGMPFDNTYEIRILGTHAGGLTVPATLHPTSENKLILSGTPNVVSEPTSSTTSSSGNVVNLQLVTEATDDTPTPAVISGGTKGIILAANNISLKDITIKNCTQNGIHILSGQNCLIENVTIEDNSFVNYGSRAIACDYSGTFSGVIQNCHMGNNGQRTELYMRGDWDIVNSTFEDDEIFLDLEAPGNAKVELCSFEGNTTKIWFYHVTKGVLLNSKIISREFTNIWAPSYNFEMSNNLIISNDLSGDLTSNMTTSFGASSSMLISNNTIYCKDHLRLYLSIYSPQLVGNLYNNIFSATTLELNAYGALPTFFKSDYNLWDYDNLLGYVGSGQLTSFSQWQALGMDANSKFADPQFTDIDSLDFSLQSSSPCIDAANGDFAPSLDILGCLRFDVSSTTDTGTGSIPYADIGAYEFGASPPIPVTVISSSPANSSSTAMPWSRVSFAFNAELNADVAGAIKMFDSIGNELVGEAVIVDNQIIFTPQEMLEYDSEYSVVLSSDAATGIKDVNGNLLDGNDNGTLEGSPVDDVRITFKTRILPSDLSQLPDISSVEITTPGLEGPYVSGDTLDSIIVTVSGGNGPYVVELAGMVDTEAPFEFTDVALPEGDEVIIWRADVTDADGNTGYVSAAAETDNTPPTFEITKPFHKTSSDFGYLYIGDKDVFVTENTPERDRIYERNVIDKDTPWAINATDMNSGVTKLIFQRDGVDAYLTEVEKFASGEISGRPAGGVGSDEDFECTVTIIVEDEAGNRATQQLPVRIDTTPPETSFYPTDISQDGGFFEISGDIDVIETKWNGASANKKALTDKDAEYSQTWLARIPYSIPPWGDPLYYYQRYCENRYFSYTYTMEDYAGNVVKKSGSIKGSIIGYDAFLAREYSLGVVASGPEDEHKPLVFNALSEEEEDEEPTGEEEPPTDEEPEDEDEEDEFIYITGFSDKSDVSEEYITLMSSSYIGSNYQTVAEHTEDNPGENGYLNYSEDFDDEWWPEEDTPTLPGYYALNTYVVGGLCGVFKVLDNHALNVLQLKNDTISTGRQIVYIHGGFPKDATGIDIEFKKGEDATGSITVATDVAPRIIEEDIFNATIFRTIECVVDVSEDALGKFDIIVNVDDLVDDHEMKDVLSVIQFKIVNEAGERQDFIYPMDASDIRFAILIDELGLPWPFTLWSDFVKFLMDSCKVYIKITDPEATDDVIYITLTGKDFLGNDIETIENFPLNRQADGTYLSGAVIAYNTSDTEELLTEEEKGKYPQYTFIDPVSLEVKKDGVLVETPSLSLYLDCFSKPETIMNYLQYSIAIKDDLQNYIPGYSRYCTQSISTKIVSGRLEINEPQALKLVIPYESKTGGTVTSQLEATITTCTSLPGFCSNAGSNSTAEKDFSFSKTANKNKGNFVYDTTLKAFIVEFYCKDYGGKCEITVSGSIQLNQDIFSISPITVQIPIDKDNDDMADCWEEAQVKQHNNMVTNSMSLEKLTPSFDGEKPRNTENPHDGDGLCAFDEYRGFMIHGIHQRISSAERDVFYTRQSLTVDGKVYNVTALQTEKIKTELVYTVHELNQYEYDNETREVNMNGKKTISDKTIPPQYCIVFKLVNAYHAAPANIIPARTWGMPASGNVSREITREIPKNIRYVKFYFEPYINGRYWEENLIFPDKWQPIKNLDGGAYHASIAQHEFGHCVFIDHGQDEEEPTSPHNTSCLMRGKGALLKGSNFMFCFDKCGKETKVK